MRDFERSFFQELFLGHWVPNIHNNNISKNTKRRKKKRWTGKQWLWRMLLECFLDGSMSKSLLQSHCFIIIHISVTSLPHTSGGIKSEEKSGERQMEAWAYKHGNKHDVIYQQHETYQVCIAFFEEGILVPCGWIGKMRKHCTNSLIRINRRQTHFDLNNYTK